MNISLLKLTDASINTRVVLIAGWVSAVLVASGCNFKSSNTEASVQNVPESEPAEVKSESPGTPNVRLKEEDESALNAPEQPVQANEDKQFPESADNTNPDEEYGKLILGTWQDDYQGERTMTVRNDGTATMIVKPDGLAALYAGEMTFEEEWKIEDGRLNLHATGGEPKVRVNLILETMGNKSDYKILELTRDRMLLEDKDGKTRFDWRRIDQVEEASDKPSK